MKISFWQLSASLLLALWPQISFSLSRDFSKIASVVPAVVQSSGFPAVANNISFAVDNNGLIVASEVNVAIKPPIAIYTNNADARLNVRATGKFVHKNATILVPQGFTNEIHYSNIILFGKVFASDNTVHSVYLGAASINSVDAAPRVIVGKTTAIPLAGAYQSLIEVEVTS